MPEKNKSPKQFPVNNVTGLMQPVNPDDDHMFGKSEGSDQPGGIWKLFFKHLSCMEKILNDPEREYGCEKVIVVSSIKELSFYNIG
jgi:hypothetical protein